MGQVCAPVAAHPARVAKASTGCAGSAEDGKTGEDDCGSGDLESAADSGATAAAAAHQVRTLAKGRRRCRAYRMHGPLRRTAAGRSRRRTAQNARW